MTVVLGISQWLEQEYVFTGPNVNNSDAEKEILELINEIGFISNEQEEYILKFCFRNTLHVQKQTLSFLRMKADDYDTALRVYGFPAARPQRTPKRMSSLFYAHLYKGSAAKQLVAQRCVAQEWPGLEVRHLNYMQNKLS